MAAIDPDAAPEFEDDADSSKPARSTLKIVRMPLDLDMDEDEDDEDYEDDSEEDSDDEEINGGPSDKTKAKIRKAANHLIDLEDGMDEDEDESGEEGPDLKSVISQLLKGKAPATGDEDEDDEDDEGLELEEIVVCTLDTEKVSTLCVEFMDDVPLISFLAMPTSTRHHRCR